MGYNIKLFIFVSCHTNVIISWWLAKQTNKNKQTNKQTSVLQEKIRSRTDSNIYFVEIIIKTPNGEYKTEETKTRWNRSRKDGRSERRTLLESYLRRKFVIFKNKGKKNQTLNS